jgi:hypothetical protein
MAGGGKTLAIWCGAFRARRCHGRARFRFRGGEGEAAEVVAMRFVGLGFRRPWRGGGMSAGEARATGDRRRSE